jgi:hypothetical protein
VALSGGVMKEKFHNDHCLKPESVTIEWRSERNAGANRRPCSITKALPGELRKCGSYVLKRQGRGI